MERRIRAQRAITEASGAIRRRRVSLWSRFPTRELGVVPPARQTLGSSTTGEVVTAMMIAWARTLAAWSVIACVVLAVILLVRSLLS